MTERTHTEPKEVLSAARLWFGFAGAGVAWVLAGLLNVLLAGATCTRDKPALFSSGQTEMHIVLAVLTFLLLALAAWAGIVSFQNWRTLSRQEDFVDAEGRGRKEFMAVFGVFVSASLGMGIIWFVLPIYIVRMCVRAH
jgi:hypothetical protein